MTLPAQPVSISVPGTALYLPTISGAATNNQNPTMKRYATAFVIFSYLLLSTTPFIPLVYGRPLNAPWQSLLLPIYGWLGLWAIFGRARYFHLFLLPLFIAWPCEWYLQKYYAQGITAHHLGIMFETSPREALEFLGSLVLFLLLGLLAVIFWWWLVWRATTKASLQWRHWSRWPALALVLIVAGMWCWGEEIGTYRHTTASASRSSGGNLNLIPGKHREALQDFPGRLASWAQPPVTIPVLAASAPLGLYWRLGEFIAERRYLAELAEKSAAFQFHARFSGPLAMPHTIVLVIGESSRYDRWSLNGYQRETNPLLRQQSNLISFSDMITAVAATRLSVPVIVSRKPAQQSLKAGFSEKSVLSAFKEAGYKTYWLSNQMSFGEFDTPVSVFAKEADVTQFLNLGGYTNGSQYDDVLLAPIEHALADRHPLKLIVVHSLGNHWNYAHRYPASFDQFKPSLFGVENPAYTDMKNKQALNNSYDNSILYTDWWLNQVIQRLRQLDSVAGMIYISDHGQTLYDGSCELAFHGHNTEFEFHVPALFWYSNEFAEAYPDKIKQARRLRSARLSTENIFHSLVDMAAIRYPDEKPERSFFSAQWRYHTRYVDSYGWSDYDNSSLKGDCREVIDKNTPLRQE